MTELKTGDRAPIFKLPATGGKTLSLKDFAGKPLVLYFYPKDDTSGCTAESCDFRDNIAAFKKIGAAVVGLSKDSIKSHEKFVEKYDLNFPLLSDEDCKVCDAYGTWVQKSMYGRKYMGIERSTFLIDGSGRIAAIWRKVKVSDHVAEVMEELKALNKKAA